GHREARPTDLRACPEPDEVPAGGVPLRRRQSRIRRRARRASGDVGGPARPPGSVPGPRGREDNDAGRPPGRDRAARAMSEERMFSVEEAQALLPAISESLVAIRKARQSVL